MKVDLSPSPKRIRSNPIHLMDYESTKAKLVAAKEKFGREVRVFETSAASSTPTNVGNAEEDDDFYEFTAEDYYRLTASKKEDKFLKTRKLREAEEAARRSRMTKAVIRVRFPDNHTLEAVFHPSETLQTLVDLLIKVINHPEIPFYIYTTPPKKKIRDTVQDFYSAAFVPGAIVYFSYDLPEGGDFRGDSDHFLKEEVMALKGLEFMPEQTQPDQPSAGSVAVSGVDVAVAGASAAERKPGGDKKKIKPKWLKM